MSNTDLMIYIILVNWRGYKDTIECLESLMHLQRVSVRIVVVDNESSDEGVSLIRSWAHQSKQPQGEGNVWDVVQMASRKEPNELWVGDAREFPVAGHTAVNIIRNPENSGFAGANNIGMRVALADPRCLYIWLLNSDTVVAPNALEEMLGVIGTSEEVGICGSTLVYYDAPDTVQSIGGVFNRFTGRGVNLQNGTPVAHIDRIDIKPGAIEYIVGASMLIPRKFVETIGLMDERYFLYFEELDWIYRSRDRYTVAWARKSIVYHKEGRSIGTNSRGRSSLTSLYYYNASFLRFTTKFSAYLLPLIVTKLAAVALIYALRADIGGFRAIVTAMTDVLFGVVRRGPITASQVELNPR